MIIILLIPYYYYRNFPKYQELISIFFCDIASFFKFGTVKE